MYKQLDYYRKWLTKNSSEFVEVSVDTYIYEDAAEQRVTADVVLGTGGPSAYVDFTFTLGDNKSIKKARKKLDILLNALDLIDNHILDAEMGIVPTESDVD